MLHHIKLKCMKSRTALKQKTEGHGDTNYLQVTVMSSSPDISGLRD